MHIHTYVYVCVCVIRKIFQQRINNTSCSALVANSALLFTCHNLAIIDTRAIK